MKAMDLANYIINKSIEIDNPVNNLQLQKILYFINALHYKRYGAFLITDESFLAWRHGPVIESVFDKLAINCAEKLKEVQDEIDPNIQKDEAGEYVNFKLIDEDIAYFSKIDPWTLVEFAQHPEGAWAKTTQGSVIHKRLIIAEVEEVKQPIEAEVKEKAPEASGPSMA